jgi:hypothetical protein
MARDDNAASGHVEAAVSFVRGWIFEEDTGCGSRGEFVWGGGSEVWIAEASENSK